MEPEQKKLIRESFALVARNSEQAGLMVYTRMFELDPMLRALFKGDIKEQSRHLMAMLGVAVADLDNLEKLLPSLRQLGRRHAGYGVQPEHLMVGGEALLWTLEHGLGAAFTPQMREAWAEAYHAISTAMLEGMQESTILAEALLAKPISEETIPLRAAPPRTDAATYEHRRETALAAA